ncbi:YicC/YloC family endoribonuclease [Reinekea thalattae]|uniref:YicC family protein n=1 Tax=Reinekea thalattae TaxID=2593301 RepID=A0A5C8ZBZ4_9GAMM|nr:YicC/YloC family endoribonuclease [Reinekea thalattae]TXR54809.1 YicC family protein [Reinekea thalattae]
MTYSMTAFARKEQSFDFGTLSVEIKSVNQRYLEPSFRLPETLRPIEMKLRELLKKQVKRGKLEVNAKFYANNDEQSLGVDSARLAAVTGALQTLSESVDNAAPINLVELLQYPGILISNEIDTEQVQAEMTKLFSNALDDFLAGREREGAVLAQAIEDRLVDIADIVQAIRLEVPEWVQSFRNNLKEKAFNLGVELNPERLEQEVVLLAQKADVAEELDRLDGHVKECRTILKQKGAVGRKLDFLMQEFNREANTLGSKSTKESITRNAVQLKVLIEQMREQVQNIE